MKTTTFDQLKPDDYFIWHDMLLVKGDANKRRCYNAVNVVIGEPNRLEDKEIVQPTLYVWGED